jgi:hypothetical protein
MTNSHDIGRLVVTLDSRDEAMTLMAHTANGPVPVWFQVAEPKGCRCGCGAHKVKVRVVAPKSVRLQRVPLTDVPE